MGGGLLGLLLGPAGAGAYGLAVQADLGGEHLVMVGSGLAQQGVAQALAALALYELLQLRLVVAEQQRGAAGVQGGEYVPLYEAARGVYAFL